MKGQDILLINKDNDVFALSGKCPHADMPMEGSEVLKGTCQIKCKWHHAIFNMENGEVVKWCEEVPLKNSDKVQAYKVEKTSSKGQSLQTFPIIIHELYIWVSLSSQSV